MPEEANERPIELKEQELEDLLGRVPGWITRNGTLLFVFLMALLLFVSWVFRYPDSREARIVVTSVHPPADLEARISGKIQALFVEDNQLVEGGDVLAVLENPASYADIGKLKPALSSLKSAEWESREDGQALEQLQELGGVQDEYAAFMKAFRDLKRFRELDYHSRRIALLREETVRQEAFARSLADRVKNSEEAYQLAERAHQRNETLFKEEVVSEADLEASRAEMLTKRDTWQELLSMVAANRISLGRIAEQIVDLELKFREAQSGYLNNLEHAHSRLLAALASWEQQFLLVAPVSGTVTFTRFWSVNQNVEAGEKVLTVLPSESGEMIGKISLPLAGAGKVSVGKQVNISFDNYPHLEFGMVKGLVRNISRVPEDDYYVVEVSLPDGLKTFYGKEIPFSEHMQGRAEILTDKTRLLVRVLNPLRSALSRQREM